MTASRFDEAGLTYSEINLMLGHSGGDTTSIYINSKLKVISEKLDAYKLNEKIIDIGLMNIASTILGEVGEDPHYEEAKEFYDMFSSPPRDEWPIVQALMTSSGTTSDQDR
jgi:hypothetical protein